jgi:hypothetical protein
VRLIAGQSSCLFCRKSDGLALLLGGGDVISRLLSLQPTHVEGGVGVKLQLAFRSVELEVLVGGRLLLELLQLQLDLVLETGGVGDGLALPGEVGLVGELAEVARPAIAPRLYADGEGRAFGERHGQLRLVGVLAGELVVVELGLVGSVAALPALLLHEGADVRLLRDFRRAQDVL